MFNRYYTTGGELIFHGLAHFVICVAFAFVFLHVVSDPFWGIELEESTIWGVFFGSLVAAPVMAVLQPFTLFLEFIENESR